MCTSNYPGQSANRAHNTSPNSIFVCPFGISRDPFRRKFPFPAQNSTFGRLNCRENV
jgi:hypothetical protein